MRKLWDIIKALYKVLVAIGAFGVLVGLFIWFLNYYYVEHPKQVIEQQSLALEQTRQASEVAPSIVSSYIIAESPNLKAKSDQEQMEQWGLKVRVVPTTWQLSEFSRYVEGSGTWYLFFLMVNNGPGHAKQIDIDVRVRPLGGTDFEPAGDLIEGLADWLRGNSMAPGYAFALLLDSIQAPNGAQAKRLVENALLTRCFLVNGSFCDVFGSCRSLFDDPKGKTIGCGKGGLSLYFKAPSPE